jgi:hypothetical protein
MLLIECALVLVGVGIAFLRPTIGTHWFEGAERAFSNLARRRWLAVIVVGVTALALRLALLPLLPIPEPIVHDEFGYLLAADTFAHGRLTNPTHPMWVHFETFSIIQKPTYQCFAQPAQGLMLALGQVVAGHPFWGVWFSAGLMCAALCWMLQGWIPARWALLGGFLAILRYATTTYWGNSYWGGAVGALGGALVLGALPRIKRSQRIRDALVMGMGLAILANSRPFEGFVLSLPVAVALFAWVAGKQRPAFGISLQRVILPLCLLVAVFAVAMGYYCWRVTGNPLQMPYQTERKEYAVAPYFLWQPLRPRPVYRSEIVKRLYARDEVLGYEFFRSSVGVLAKVWTTWRFYLGPVLTLPLLMMAVVLPYGFSWRQINKRTRFLLIVLGLALVGMALESSYFPHYMGPSTAILLALIMLAMRHLQLWRWRGKPSGLFLARAVPVICFVLFVLRAAAGPFKSDVFHSPAWYQRGPTSFGRAALLRKLQQLEGKQLVIVRYKPGRDPFEEWVYNEADIDAAKVVWAREISSADDMQLITYFKGHRIWLLEPDEKPARLSEYPVGELLPSGQQ